MKKLVIVCLALLLTNVAWAEEAKTAEPFLEVSGHVNAGAAFTYQNDKPASTAGGVFVQEQMAAPRTDLNDKSQFGFFVNEAELDLAKSFGENVKVRADLDFGRINSYSRQAFDLEQAYAAFNLFGAELLVGRFNAGIGSESVDINDNALPAHSMIFDYLLPRNLTGAKIFYKFNDNFNLQIWTVNNLRDDLTAKLDIPAFGGKVGLTFGDLKFGVSGAASPEVNTDKYGDWTYLTDVTANYLLMDNWSLGLEGIFRYDSAPDGLVDNKYYAGKLETTYSFSDVWDGTLQYVFLRDTDGNTGGASINAMPASQMHIWGPGFSATGMEADYQQISLGATYNIADGAKIQTMYRMDLIDVEGFDLGMAQSVMANLAFSF